VWKSPDRPIGRAGGQAKVVFLGAIRMNALGIFLIMGSLVFVASGLLLTLPSKHKSSADDQESFEESRARTEFYLRKMREERGEHGKSA
jgi:hypothetical protein